MVKRGRVGNGVELESGRSRKVKLGETLPLQDLLILKKKRFQILNLEEKDLKKFRAKLAGIMIAYKELAAQLNSFTLAPK